MGPHVGRHTLRNTSSVTFGRSRYCRTGAGGGSSKQSTLVHPCRPSWTETSRAWDSVPPIRVGLSPKIDRTLRFTAVESGRDGRRADVFLARRQSPIETAALLPEPWPMPPDIPDWSVLDVAHGRCPRAHSDVPVRLKLQHSQRRAEQAAFVGCVGLSRYPEGVRVAEIGNH